ncbi:HAD family phosphatase [Candidatus Kaiserbacteria bacterium]|nr:HAD family phosphatase [Candidatus Kaiserbacteria bacterium]
MKAVIFDLNGVFILSPKLSERFEKNFGVSSDIFLPALKKVMSQVRLPNAPSLYSCWAPYFKEWGLTLDEKSLERYWFNAETENVEMTELAKELKARGVRLFILSNNLRERGNFYDIHFPFLNELFDKCYFSWKTGFIKPDVRAYKLILDENGLDAIDCVYFDDSKENVEVAASLGIQSYLYESPSQVKDVLV